MTHDSLPHRVGRVFPRGLDAVPEEVDIGGIRHLHFGWTFGWCDEMERVDGSRALESVDGATALGEVCMHITDKKDFTKNDESPKQKEAMKWYPAYAADTASLIHRDPTGPTASNTVAEHGVRSWARLNVRGRTNVICNHSQHHGIPCLCNCAHDQFAPTILSLAVRMHMLCFNDSRTREVTSCAERVCVESNKTG